MPVNLDSFRFKTHKLGLLFILSEFTSFWSGQELPASRLWYGWVATWPDRLNIAGRYDSYNTIQYKNFNPIFNMTCLFLEPVSGTFRCMDLITNF
jgi:hypothetical protein